MPKFVGVRADRKRARNLHVGRVDAGDIVRRRQVGNAMGERFVAMPRKIAEARRQSVEATVAEKILWRHLCGEAQGVRFRRQHTLLGFIVDFYAPGIQLAVEVDGPIHALQAEYDQDRSSILALHGVTVMRLANDDVLDNLPHALFRIRQKISHLRGIT